MEKKNLKQEVFAYMLLILGSALFAVGDVMFVNPYLMAPGGTYGLSNVFSTLWGGKISVWAICMDVPLLIIGTWILGPKFGVKTIISTFLIFGFTYAIESWIWGYNPVIHDGPIVANAIEGLNMVQTHDGMWFVPDYFLNTVVAGLIYGVAIGMIFRSGATSGGSDIISMILHKYTKISLGTLVTIVACQTEIKSVLAKSPIKDPSALSSDAKFRQNGVTHGSDCQNRSECPNFRRLAHHAQNGISAIGQIPSPHGGQGGKLTIGGDMGDGNSKPSAKFKRSGRMKHE